MAAKKVGPKCASGLGGSETSFKAPWETHILSPAEMWTWHANHYLVHYFC